MTFDSRRCTDLEYRYGIGSFVYRARKPFDPEKLFNFFKGKFHLFQPKEEEEEDHEQGKEAEETSVAGSDDDTDNDTDDDTDDDVSSSTIDNNEGPTAENNTPGTSPLNSDDSDEDKADEDESLGKIVENKRNDPLLAGVYRLKGFIWLATRPKMTGEISAAGAILTVAGFQEWHAEKLFGSCTPCTETRDAAPIKDLMEEMLKRRNSQPWLQITDERSGVRDKVARCLYACYFSSAEIERWFAIADDAKLDDDKKEEELEDMLLEKFDDLNLEYVYLICRDIVGLWGDRRQEMVFIGEQLDSVALTKALDDCLLTDEEMVQWEQVMRDNELDKKATKMLNRARAKLEEGSQLSKKKIEKLEDRMAEARFYIAEAKEEKLQDLWNDDKWAEWFVDDSHDHDHDHDGDDA